MYPPNPVHRMLAASLVLAMIGTATAVRADEVIGNNVPIPNVDIIGIDKGDLVYKRNGKEERKALADVKGIKVDSLPLVAEITGLILEKKDDKTAAAKVPAALGRVPAKDLWLKSWLLDQRVRCMLRSNAAVDEMVDVYATLVELKPDGYFPVSLGKELNPKVHAAPEPVQRKCILRLLKTKQPDKATDGAQVALDDLLAQADPKLLETIQAELVKVPPPPNGGGSATTPLPSAVAFSQPLRADASVVPQDFEAVMLFTSGKIADEKAVEMLEKEMSTKTSRADIRLYALGRAYQECAIKEKDAAQAKKLWLKAGVYFARVVAQLGRHENSRPPAYAPSLVELARVHKEIGRKDLAKEFLDEAESLLDPTKDAPTKKRLDVLAAELGN